ncbi:4,5-DOPA dioxygenase extradiol [uncultured Ilyobacter sp.]|uniref:4,5-DOPA-extradiol-dioxygenase n=1 Tax=uncultured Ilyobacter sp. TaxID=544433 RepID=UPI0029C8E99D|nr:4,5-DOPA dioxygenase extradiol [uncultured Ilyobacter sp.]
MSKKQPVLFIGHGNPMNAISDNSFTKSLKKISENIEKPEAILVISAHWQTRGTSITASDNPRQIYDFYGFPEDLYRVVYNPKGKKELSSYIVKALNEVDTTVIGVDYWGLDHGSWAVLTHIYPEADIPVLQLSLDAGLDEKSHYELGKKLSFLRDMGVLVIGSGNIVHNLKEMGRETYSEPHPWAVEFDRYISESIIAGKHEKLISYKKAGECSELSLPTDEHYLPLLYIAAMQNEGEKVEFLFDEIHHSSLSMRCLKIG